MFQTHTLSSQCHAAHGEQGKAAEREGRGTCARPNWFGRVPALNPEKQLERPRAGLPAEWGGGGGVMAEPTLLGAFLSHQARGRAGWAGAGWVAPWWHGRWYGAGRGGYGLSWLRVAVVDFDPCKTAECGVRYIGPGARLAHGARGIGGGMVEVGTVRRLAGRLLARRRARRAAYPPIRGRSPSTKQRSQRASAHRALVSTSTPSCNRDLSASRPELTTEAYLA